jgi:hypothetical protein
VPEIIRLLAEEAMQRAAAILDDSKTLTIQKHFSNLK